MVGRYIAFASALFIAASAQCLAMMMVGGGHGWLTPFWLSLLLWGAYPAACLLVLKRSRKDADKGHALAIALTGLALAADGLLVAFDDPSYFHAMFAAAPEIVIGWILLWVGWQVPPFWVVGKGALNRM
jgi:hypothetical protein